MVLLLRLCYVNSDIWTFQKKPPSFIRGNVRLGCGPSCYSKVNCYCLQTIDNLHVSMYTKCAYCRYCYNLGIRNITSAALIFAWNSNKQQNFFAIIFVMRSVFQNISSLTIQRKENTLLPTDSLNMFLSLISTILEWVIGLKMA